MQDDKKEFTLKQVGEVLKKGWLTILVYVLIAAIVFGSLAAIVKTYATTNDFRAKIGFVNTVTPDELATLNSSENITKALGGIGFKEEDIPAYVDEVRAAISITPNVYSNQTDSETQFVPSSYTITMTEVDGLSESKSIQVLNQIVTNFIIDFNQKNSSASINTENEQAFADYSSNDYVEIAYELSNKIDAMLTTAESLASRSTTFISSSTNMTFADFISMLESIRSQVESFDGFVTIKGITKATSGLSASEYITMRLNLAQSEQVRYEETVSKWKEIIDQVTANGSFSGTIDGQTIVIQDQTSYFNFLNKYIAAVESASEASADYNYWHNKQTVFNDATEFPDGSETDKANLIAEADKKVSLLVATTTQMIEIYNDIVGDYNNSGISSAKSASLITPAYVTSASAISNTMMILIIALAVVLAAAIGFVRVRGRYLASLDGKAVEDGAKTA